MTQEKMRKILKSHESFISANLDKGICEFYEKNGMSIGVSYEHIGFDTPYVGYIVNLFVDGEYINIPSIFVNLEDASEILAREWNEWQNRKENQGNH